MKSSLSGMCAMALGSIHFGLFSLSACGGLLSGGEADAPLFEASTTTDFTSYWQPFTRDSPWNLKLAPDRKEELIPAQGMALGPMAPSDAEYGVKVYVARSSDPQWTITYGGYNNGSHYFGSGGAPVVVRAPLGMTAPTGWDATVFLIEENRVYAYEMYQFAPRGATSAYSAYMTRVDLRSNGIVQGITGSSLPGIGGLIKSWETKNKVEIRHKLWVAAHWDLVYNRAVWPAPWEDAQKDGRYAFLNYGDVVALTKSLNVASNECYLSPFMQRIAQALKDYGGIVVDKGADSLQFVGEVGSIENYIDIDPYTTMWVQFACLKKYMVKVTNPWTGATPGGLGYDAAPDTTPPSVPQGLTGRAISSTQITLDWQDSMDNVKLSGYRVYRNNTQIAQVQMSAYTDSGLRAATTYRYHVRAYDAAGNLSASSTAVSIKTP